METKGPCGSLTPDPLFGSGFLLCQYFISDISTDPKKALDVGAAMDLKVGVCELRYGE